MTTTPPAFSPFVSNHPVRSSQPPPVARHVAITLRTYANRAGEAWPTQATLERGTGWARRPVNTALNALEAEGWLTRLVKGHKGRATLYRLHVPGTSTGLPRSP